MPRIRRRRLTTGGLLNHDTHGQLQPKVINVSRRAPIDDRDESSYQVGFFDFIRLNAPQPPVRMAVKNLHEVLDDPNYLTHPFYVLTRVRHFPNGGHRVGAVAAQMKAEGVKRGAFDIHLDAARRGYHGFRVELKAQGKKLNPYQVEEMRWLRSENYFAHAAWHEVEVIALLLWYLSIPFPVVRGLHSRHAIPDLSKGHDAQCGCDHKLVKWW